MEFSSSQREAARGKFEKFCKKVICEYYRDLMKSIIRLSQREVSIDNLSEKEMERLLTFDEYESDLFHINARGYDVAIVDEALYVALSKLPEQYRDILLLYWFIKLNDREISELINQPRSTVQNRRTSSFERLQKMLGVNQCGKV